jgi:hypothetical protein
MERLDRADIGGLDEPRPPAGAPFSSCVIVGSNG